MLFRHRSCKSIAPMGRSYRGSVTMQPPSTGTLENA